MSQCTAKAKCSGTQCQRAAMHGRTVCYMHGGKSLRGIASRTLKSGRYSKDLPTRLAARYQESQADPDLLNLHSEISLTDAFVLDALKGLDTGESGRLWQSLNTTWQTLQDAQRAKDGQAVALALNDLGSLIKRGIAAHAARSETMDLIERRRKLVESESKRRVQMQDMITSEKAMLLVGQLTAAVVRYVSDPKALAGIAAEFGAITARDDPAAS